MSDLQPHPLADLFPLMVGAEFDALVEDIRVNGQRQPVVVFEDQILDGRNRYRACTKIGLEPRIEQFAATCSPQSFVASMNLHRRHLNESQRALIGSRMATLPNGARPIDASSSKEEPRQICLGAISQAEAGRLLNVSASSVKSARVVLEHGTPEEIAGVENGTLAVGTIAREIHKNVPPAERARSRALPLGERGRLPARNEKHRFNAALWGQLRDGLTNFSGLPSPVDMVKIARGSNQSKIIVNQKLAIASKWLAEFEDEWTRAS